MTDGPSQPKANWDRARALFLRVSRQQFTVGTGIAVARAAGFLTGAIAARNLGLSGFAVYTVGFTLFTSLTQLTSFADTWLISRWADESRRVEVMKAVWRIKFAVSVGLTAVAIILSAAAPDSVTKLGINGWTLTIAVAAAGSAALTTALASRYQAERRFLAYSAVLAVCPCSYLLVTAVLAAVRIHNPAWYLGAILASYTPLAYVTYLRFDSAALPSQIRPSLVRDALHFGGWVTVGSLAYVVFQRIDVFVLAALAPGPDVGTYGVATRFAAIAAVFGSTITAVLMPTGSIGSTWTTPGPRRSYVAESVLSVGLVSAALVLGILAVPVLIRVAFGGAYDGAVGPTRILLLGQVILIAQMPFYFALYGLKGERWIAGLGVGQLLASVMAAYWLIGRYGLAGAAWSNVATYSLGLAIVVLFHVMRRARSGLEA
jgi:O-antigen/teichoic acid export membrane protein